VASTIILELRTTLALACVVNYDRKLTLQIVASLRIVNYDRNSFIIQATEQSATPLVQRVRLG
jgi:hypothetical protein